MNKSEVVNITIFGGKGIFGGRETRKEAVISSCAFADSCNALKQGRCAASNPRMDSCVNMDVKLMQGYTSKARKYGEFLLKWKGHEKYGAVKERLKRFEHVGNNTIRIKLPHINIEKALAGEKGYSAINSGEVYYINKDDFTLDSLKKIMESYSNALMGGALKNTEEKEEMLLAIKEIDKNLYDEYMESTGHEINYVGKSAYLVSLKPNINLPGGWYWDGEYMYRENLGSVDCGIVKGFVKGSEVKFKPEESSYIEIKNGEWVCEDTRFKA